MVVMQSTTTKNVVRPNYQILYSSWKNTATPCQIGAASENKPTVGIILSFLYHTLKNVNIENTDSMNDKKYIEWKYKTF